MLKKILSSVFCLISIFSCSITNNVVVTNKNVESTQKESYIADVGKGKLGARFSTELKFVEGFNTKANIPGNQPQTIANIAKVDAFLIEVDTAPLPSSDPLSTVYAVVPNIPKTSEGTFLVTFINVPDNESGKRYYVGIIAKDTLGRIISKNPTPDWSGTSADRGLWVTNGGGDTGNPGSVRVTSALNVTSTTPLTVNIYLLDVNGARIETNATVINGSTTLSPIDAVGI